MRAWERQAFLLPPTEPESAKVQGMFDRETTTYLYIVISTVTVVVGCPLMQPVLVSVTRVPNPVTTAERACVRGQR